MSNRHHTRSQAGFTMGETLIAVAILVILMGIVTPAALSSSRSSTPPPGASMWLPKTK